MNLAGFGALRLQVQRDISRISQQLPPSTQIALFLHGAWSLDLAPPWRPRVAVPQDTSGRRESSGFGVGPLPPDLQRSHACFVLRRIGLYWHSFVMVVLEVEVADAFLDSFIGVGESEMVCPSSPVNRLIRVSADLSTLPSRDQLIF